MLIFFHITVKFSSVFCILTLLQKLETSVFRNSRHHMCSHILIFHHVHVMCAAKLHKIRASQWPQLTINNGDKGGGKPIW